MGSDNFVTLKVSGIVDKASFLMYKTKEIEDPQMELLLLKCCTGSAKLIYWLRNCVPEVIKDQILLFDIAIDQSLQHILGVPIHDQDRLKIHLPLSMGGLGIAKASLVANAAFVSSVASSWMLQPNSSPRKRLPGNLQHYNLQRNDRPYSTEKMLFFYRFSVLIPN